jgi:hypothetical protein
MVHASPSKILLESIEYGGVLLLNSLLSLLSKEMSYGGCWYYSQGGKINLAEG